MKSLIHKGVVIPKYQHQGLSIKIRGTEVSLSPGQEEMAIAWCKKLGTDYVKDSAFVKNFFRDFSTAMRQNLPCEDVDFEQVIDFVEKNKIANLSKEERKKRANERAVQREENKRKFGYAIIDGVRMEIANYSVEPSSIFMGRGRHPFRGCWKEGPKESDIILNLSRDAPIPEGNWKEITWEPESMWIAKWKDKLVGKFKYLWISETSPLRQKREQEKYDEALELGKYLPKLKQHIVEGMRSENVQRRKVATVCALIDELKLRVGDEKDPDEADTVGATTLRPEHVKIIDNTTARFHFLAKDSIPFHKTVQLPEPILSNISAFKENSGSEIFSGITSTDVSDFLREICPFATAKIFRTYYASKEAERYLNRSDISSEDSEFKKEYVLKMAILNVAKLLNHKKKLPKNWDESIRKKKERLEKLKREKKTKQMPKATYKLSIAMKTGEWNLNTSLKSYIHPRILAQWAKKVGFDWRKIYTPALQRKFAWAGATEMKASS